ncbi:MAG: tyrosine-type recombinase/integrase [Erysipelotrichaceae bacterium]
MIYKRREKGTGSIYKLSGIRRNPWVACITIGYNNENGKQQQKPIGYFKTRDEAVKALPSVTVKTRYITNMHKEPKLIEIWNSIYEEEIQYLSSSSKTGYKAAINNFSELFELSIVDIDIRNIQPIFTKMVREKSGKSKLNKARTVISKIYSYAIKYDYVEKDYSTYIKYTSIKEQTELHVPFTHKEIKLLWKNGSYSSLICLLLIYTGLRPKELFELERINIHLSDKYIIAGSKTNNGRNRIIPLHDEIIPIIKELISVKNSYKYLLSNSVNSNSYNSFRLNIFEPLMRSLKMTHTPYDTRHTFATLCYENKLNDFLVKKIIGHSCYDITKGIYTHVSIERLVLEVNLINILSDK